MITKHSLYISQRPQVRPIFGTNGVATSVNETRLTMMVDISYTDDDKAVVGQLINNAEQIKERVINP